MVTSANTTLKKTMMRRGSRAGRLQAAGLLNEATSFTREMPSAGAGCE